ncbi:PTS sugar transporter subunit IIC [Miniphocaeibacter halophilus]|uniref:PTS sugar transporter subunit IIC n=1 Tax=Miniphocaeibacter halophilus TaxID=2931922 RepID=A0AC61MS23_9FIRM|nr:PTS transporter subunit EIIC [Miniphocaeibacter halophilus]QQK08380.1 PTS sugar transporter subunit IIC [Miniphocaeibacter halophilus]
MKKLINFLEEKVAPIAGKISGQRHMMAVRKGLVATMPLIIVGSFFTIFNNFPIDSIKALIDPYMDILDIPFRFTVGVMALYATYGIAATLAESYKLDTLSSGMMAVLAFLITTIKPIRVLEDVDGVITAGRYLNIGSLSASSLFGAIVTALISVEIYRFMKERNFTIKLPAGVPPEVLNSFIALIPTLVVILLFWTIRHILGFDLNAFLSSLLMPLKNILAGNSLAGGLLTVFLICFFWLLGIHGPAIMAPVIRPFWDISIAENMDAFTAGVAATELPNIFTEQFIQWFVWIGGAGTTLALVVLFMFSKSNYYKSLGKLSFLPGLFNINEPIIFGAPIVMNPILGIPFVIAPLVTTILAYAVTITDIIPRMMMKLPFTMISPIAAWMSTEWNVFAGILVIINFFIAMIIYYPFFKLAEKQQVQKEEEELAAEAAREASK